jgi:putative FmdB family regulatory protein
MPRYDYTCDSCGARYERREGFDAPQEHPCPECGATARRVFVAPPILFKGSGWYLTDSRSASSAATGTSSTPTSKGDGESASSGTPAAASTEAAKPAEKKSDSPAPAPSTT